MESMDKKLALKALVEKGKAVGKLTTQEIDNAIIELDIDMEELDKHKDALEEHKDAVEEQFEAPLLQIEISATVPWVLDQANTN